MKTLIIFDIDGTLLHSNKVDSQSFAIAYKDIFDKELPTLNWHKYPHVTDTSIFDTMIQNDFNRKPTEADKSIFVNRFVEILKENRVKDPDAFMEVKGAKETIDKLLADDRFILGIATGGWEAPAMLKLQHIGINESQMIKSFADGKITRESIIQQVLDEVDIQDERVQKTVYVGDAIWDVSTTRNMDMPLIGIRLNGDKEVLTQKGATIVLKNYEEYNTFLEAVDQATVPLASE